MLQFKKPKKKKSLRKKDKLDIDALEAEAVSAGLGIGDLGSRKDGRRQAIREEQERSEAEMRNNAYQSAYAKADEASKSLRLDQTLQTKVEEEENLVFADDEEDLYKSLERARKLALKKQEVEASGPLAIAQRASTTLSSQIADDKNPETGESHENKLVFTEMEEFVSAIQLAEGIFFLVFFFLFHKISQKKKTRSFWQQSMLHWVCYSTTVCRPDNLAYIMFSCTTIYGHSRFYASS
jgi:U4/U6.U5 tri-snRNP-associated protein 1